ncbi:hypothetical protein [Streptomyces sp. NBC_00344]|uniref:hypothetical protein n=1 Tax=Streptomyces sp. NBC_00344 TaxID=2975720 RepID=UPI002E219209
MGARALAALACGAVSRYGLLPALRVLLWMVCVPDGIAAFGLLMDVTLESWGLDATVPLGALLLWGLVRPWGQVFPRWTPLQPGRHVPRWLPLGPGPASAAALSDGPWL